MSTFTMTEPVADDTLLVSEVSQSSEAYDRDAKAALYARFGVPEYWIVDVASSSLEVYRRPSKDGYDSMERFEHGTVSPVDFPDFEIQIESLL